MKLTGAQALIKSLEMEGVEVMFGLPGGAILPVYDPIIDSPIRHILVRHEQGAGHMAEGYAHATGRPGVAMVTSGPAATNIVTPLCDAYMDSIPMVVHHRPGAVDRHRHRRLPGVRHRRHHPSRHQAQRAGDRRAGHPPHRPGGVPHRHHRPARPGAHRRPQGHPSRPTMDWGTGRRRRSTLPGYKPTTKGHPRMIKEAARLIAESAPPGHLRRRRHPQGPGRRGAPGAGRAHRHPRRHHADGPGRVPRRPPAVPRHAGHARQLHRGHRHAEGRPAHRPRLPLRRPGHRQGRRRSPPTPRSSTSTSTPPSSARSAGPTCRSSATAASSSRSWCKAVARRSAATRPSPTAPRGWRRSAAGRRSTRCTYEPSERGRRAQAAVRARAAARLDARRQHRRRGRRPAPDVDDAVLEVRPPLHVGELGRPRHDGLRGARGHRRQGRPPRPHGVGRRRRRLLPDDGPGARHRRRPSASRSRSPSSTTPTSAWSASGRRCSTRSATPRCTSRPTCPTT